MHEHWRPVVGWEGFYEVSDCGRVRSVERVVSFSDGRTRVFSGRVRATYADEFGYRKVTLKRPGASERLHVHVMVAAAWIGRRPKGAHVCHSDGDHLNNQWENLRYDTPKGNVADTKRMGRLNPPTRLTEAEVQAIRNARGKLTQGELAALFNTSKTHVCNIQKGNRR